MSQANKVCSSKTVVAYVAWPCILMLAKVDWKRWCHCRFFVLIVGAIIVILLLCPSTSQRNLVKWEGDMLRAQCRSMRDGTEGWVRSSGGLGKWVNVGTSSSWRHRSRCSFGTSSFKAVHSRSLWRATRVRRGTSRKKHQGVRPVVSVPRVSLRMLPPNKSCCVIPTLSLV